MKTVAVLGGGPAGAFAAEQLSRAGLKTTLLDEKFAWEKPCGGGITYKAYSQYPFLLENDTPKMIVSRTCLSTAKAGTAALELTQPLLIYSRYHLNGMLLRRAQAAGAAIEKTRIMGVQRCGSGWTIKTRTGVVNADYCIVATGARNPLRDMGTQWSAGDTMTALGYYIPTHQEHIDIHFISRFQGYIWAFPRNDHLAVGICGKDQPASTLRIWLEKYLADRGISLKDATFYGHVLPSLEKARWRANRAAGDGWMAVGDAAGLVDPVTGEGLYYAIRSADLASSALLAESAQPKQKYLSLLAGELTAELELASSLAKRLYLGKFLYGEVPPRMIQLMRRSPTLCAILQDLFAGTQDYASLKSRLMNGFSTVMTEAVLNRSATAGVS